MRISFCRASSSQLRRARAVAFAEAVHGAHEGLAGALHHAADLVRQDTPPGHVFHEHGLLGHGHGLVTDALQIHHHAQGGHHEAQITGHGLDAGHEAQAQLVDLVFQGVDGRITVTDGDGAHGLAFFIGTRSLFQSDVHLRIHDQQARAQRGQHVLGRVILKNH